MQKQHDYCSEGRDMGEPLMCGAPWDGRSTAGGCVRDVCVREAHGCASQRGGQCDGVPSLQLSMCSDCHTIKSGSLVYKAYI